MSKRLLSMLMITGALLVPGAAAVAAPVSAPAAPLIAAQNDPGENRQGDNIDPVTGTEVKDTSVVGYISATYNWLAIIGGLLAVIMLIYAGYNYMASSGDPEKISNAKDIVEKALLGLGLLIIATILLRAVNTRTVDPCKPGEAGCGAIDFTKPDGGVRNQP